MDDSFLSVRPLSVLHCLRASVDGCMCAASPCFRTFFPTSLQKYFITATKEAH